MIRIRGAHDQLHAVLAWYGETIFGRLEGGGVLPFYCDPQRVGRFAVRRTELACGKGEALFRLFIGMAMFQARRDVVIMKQQRLFSAPLVRDLTSPSTLQRAITANGCACLASAETFDEGCDVWKAREAVDCRRQPGMKCHVKSATSAFNRMGDMGKVPTSAWFHLWTGGGGGFGTLVGQVLEREPQPTKRATMLVESLSRVHRVGRKLATMFVSALSTPALAPGLTPWFPEIDGNELVIIDTNVARAVDTLRGTGAPRSYARRERWVRERAAEINLRQFHQSLPKYSPRLVQQALYAFCSRSNRVANGDDCVETDAPCASCATSLCPFPSRVPTP